MSIIVDLTKCEKLLLEIVWQVLSDNNFTEIDNRSMSIFEDACDYLAGRGLITTENGRIYKPKIKYNIETNNWEWI